MTHQFTTHPKISITFLIILFILALTAPTTNSQFSQQCLARFQDTTKWIPVIVRAPNDSRFARNLWIVSRHIRETYGVAIKFAPNVLLTNCAAPTNSLKNAGFEISLCLSSTTLEPTPGQGWCNSSDVNRGVPRALASASTYSAIITGSLTLNSPEVAAFALFAMQKLSRYFSDCNQPLDMTCLGDTANNIARVGNLPNDGLVDGSETCDVSGYFTSSQAGCGGGFSLKYSKETIFSTVDSYCALRVGCGLSYFRFDSYSCEKGWGQAARAECAENIGIEPPDLPKQTCYWPPGTAWKCPWFAPGQWLCSDASGAESPCTDNIGVVSVVKTGQTFTGLPAIGQVIPKTETNYSCGALYRARTVRCGISGDSSAHPDSTCADRGPKPSETIELTQPTDGVLLCVTYAFSYSYPKNGLAPAIPPISTFKRYTTDSQLTAPLPPSTPCTADRSSTPCWGGCGNKYAAYVKCVQFSIANTDTGVFTISESTSCALPAPTVAAPREPKVLCRYASKCYGGVDNIAPVDCSTFQCNCFHKSFNYQQGCWGQLIAGFDAFAAQQLSDSLCTDFSTQTAQCSQTSDTNCFDLQCAVTNENNGCYTKTITFAGDPSTNPVLPSAGPADANNFAIAKYNNYCDWDGVTPGYLGVWDTNYMSFSCRYADSVSPPQTAPVLDPTWCPTLSQNHQCNKIVGYEYRCTLSIDENAMSAAEITFMQLNNYLNIAPLSQPSSNYCLNDAEIPDTVTPPLYCGEVKFLRTLGACWNKVTNTIVPQGSQEFIENCQGQAPTWTNPQIKATFTRGCKLRLYDSTDDSNLDHITTPDEDVVKAKCGTRNVEHVCTQQIQSIYIRCDIATASGFVPSFQNLCTYPTDYAGITKTSPKVLPCFQLNDDGTRFINKYTNISSLELITQDTQCPFKSLCTFTYDSTGVTAFSLDGMTTASGSLVSQPNAENCVFDFPCQRFSKFCGTASRQKTCKMTKTSDPSFSQSLLDALSGVYGGSHQLGPGIPCSTVVDSTCSSDIGCFEARCWLPNDLNVTADTDPQPARTINDYSADLCTKTAQTNHCANGVLNDCDTTKKNCYCGDIPLYVDKKCIDLRGNLSFESVPAGSTSRCSLYVDDVTCNKSDSCVFVNSQCFFSGLRDDQSYIIPGQTPSEHTCTTWTQNPDSICTGENSDLCGDAVTTSNCLMQKDDGSTFTVEDSDACIARAQASGKSFLDYRAAPLHKQCHNFRKCSQWVCSGPKNPANAIPEADIIAITKSTDISVPNAYFTDVVSPSACSTPLDTPATAGVCGMGEITRAVGCLTTLVEPYSTTPSYRFNSTVANCGVITNYPPARSQPMYSFAGCTSILTCAIGQAVFNKDTCSALTCPVVPQPTSSTSTTFWFQHQSSCIALNNTVVDQDACNSSSSDWYSSMFKTITLQQCQYASDYCRSNFQVPLGFGPEANVTKATGKYDLLSAKLVNPLSLSYTMDEKCSKKIQLTDVSIYRPGSFVPQRTNFTIFQGATNAFSVQFSTTNFNQLQALIAFLVPVIQDGETAPTSESADKYQFSQLPYPIATFSTAGRQQISIPSTIPTGEYVFVLYLNALSFKWVDSVVITVIAPASNVASIETAQTRETNPCANFNCYNGSCSVVNDKAICTCNPGFALSAGLCTTPSLCLTTPPSTFTLPTCVSPNGFIGPQLSRTTGTLTDSFEEMCSTCHCMGPFDETDGCKTCILQCGIGGVPNEGCTACVCPPGFDGVECECQHQQILLNYRSSPPIVQRMFERSSRDRENRYGSEIDLAKYTPQTPLEAAQLAAWKRILVIEVAADLNISQDSLSVVHWGSRGSLFTVVLDIKQCSGYPNYLASLQSPDTGDGTGTDTDTEASVITHAAANREFAIVQRQQLNQTWANFTQIIQLLSSSSNATAPLIGFIDTDNVLKTLRPSFNYSTLARRFKAQSGSESNVHYGQYSTDELLLEAELDQFEDESRETFSILAGNGVNADSVDMYRYRQLNSAVGVTSDGSRGFMGFGDVLYSQADCTSSPDAQCIPPVKVPALSASNPVEPTTTRKSFDTWLLIVILLPILFFLLIVGLVILCCTYYYQKWCFKGFKERRKAAKREEREARKQRREALRSSQLPSKPDSSVMAPGTNGTELAGVTSKTAASTRPNKMTSGTRGANTPTLQSIASPSLPPAVALSAGSTTAHSPPPIVIDDYDSDEEDDYEYGDAFEDGTEVSPLAGGGPINSKNMTKRGSLHIGGLRRISVADLPPGWTMLMLEGKPIYINEKTMQSTRLKPNPDGTLPESTQPDW